MFSLLPRGQGSFNFASSLLFHLINSWANFLNERVIPVNRSQHKDQKLRITFFAFVVLSENENFVRNRIFECSSHFTLSFIYAYIIKHVRPTKRNIASMLVSPTRNRH